MIPKIIHYCWFGGNPLPDSAKKCITSWKKYFPDYDIKEWNENNFDVNIIPYTAEAYKAKKYAFVSDYARFWILYNYGGLYFDTDVEVIQNMDDIIENGPFLGCECVDGKIWINSGLGLGAPRGLDFYRVILDWYKHHHFITWRGVIKTTVVVLLTKVIKKVDPDFYQLTPRMIRGIMIYPVDYFCPKNYNTGELIITQNTKSIHHYSASWTNGEFGILKKINRRYLYFKLRLWSFLFYKKNANNNL